MGERRRNAARRARVWVTVTAVLLVAVLFMLLGRRGPAPAAHAGRLRVVTTTSLLECAVREIGGRRVDARTMTAPGSCPGHYDVSPRDVRAVSTSDALFTHGYEEFARRIAESLGKDGPRRIAIRTSGNWMVPSVYARALRDVTREMCKLDPSHAPEYRRALARREAVCKALDTGLRHKLATAGVSGAAVMCADQQADVAKWMGFEVAEVYPRPEQFTPVLLHYMTSVGRRKHARLCIDNLQSGPQAGVGLAKDIGAEHVTLSSFPGGFGGTETWSKCAADNVDRVIRGLRR